MPTRHPMVFILLVALLGFFIYGAVAVLSDNDEKRIRREINAAILGVELNDPARYSAILAEDFTDSQGLARREILEKSRSPEMMLSARMIASCIILSTGTHFSSP